MVNKKLTIAAATAAAFATTLSLAVQAFAENSATSSSKLQNRLNKVNTVIQKKEDRIATRAQNLKDKFASREASLKDKFASQAARLEEAKKKRIYGFGQRVAKRFLRITERQENILGRIGTRIAKLESQGKNVSSLKTASASAASSIAKQKTDIAAFQAALDVAKTNGTANFDTLKTSVKSITDQLKATHRKLVDLVVAIAHMSGNSNKSPKPAKSASPSSTPAATP